MEILEGLRPGGKILLNGDDPLLWSVRGRPIPAVYFGEQNEDCTVRAENVTVDDGGISFRVCADGKTFPMQLALEGAHFVSDALAAVSVGLQMGVPMEKIAESLAEFQNMAGRQEIFETKGYTIIKDCYNAGPESMAAALAVLGKRPGRKIAVLGDMLELGIRAQAEHYRVGRIAAENADAVLAYGPNGSRVVSGAVTGGMDNGKARAFAERDLLVKALRAMARPGDVLLFKGSHGMHMELALEGFLADET